jgi:RNA polymerase sigma-70 factor (ECF subfamily)
MGEDRETKSDADAVAAALAEGRRAWPGVDVGADELAAYVRARLDTPVEGALADQLDGLHTSDLFLACACARGDTAAIEAFGRAFKRDLAALFARPDARGTDREDLVQKLLERLFVAETGKPPRITEYRGRGSMRTWLRVVALRVRLNAERRVSDKEDGLASQAEQRLGDGIDPELDYLKAHYRDAFRKALADALAELSPADRNLLRLQLVHGLSATGIASLHHVHRATAKRWLAALRDRVLASTRSKLMDALRIESVELDSIMRLIGSRLEASVRRHLGETQA